MEKKEKKKKKKKGIFGYFFEMVAVFIILFIGQQFGLMILNNSFTYLKYGPDVISQSIWAVLVLIIVLAFKNGYIFTQKKEKLSNSLKMGWPILTIAAVFLALNLIYIIPGVSIPVVLNLATFCLLIGIVEEFLCRGWLLNEFLERYSDSKKNIMLSIFLSSVVFGLVHFVNMIAGQNFLMTSVQVVNAVLFGVTLALIYYKTKNIWGVVLIHAFWDFAIMLGNVNEAIECYNGTVTKGALITNAIQLVVILATLISLCYWLYRKTDLSKDKKPLSKKLYYAIPIIVIVLYVGSQFIDIGGDDGYTICPVYEETKLEGGYETQYYAYPEYELNYAIENVNTEIYEGEENVIVYNDTYSFTLNYNYDTKKANFVNNLTDEVRELTDGIAKDYLLVDNGDSFIIMIQTDTDRVLFGTYLKSEISNDSSYLDIVKAGLTEYTVPDILNIGTLKFENNDYRYGLVLTKIYQKLYFDEFGNLILINE